MTKLDRRIRQVQDAFPPLRGRLMVLWLGPEDQSPWMALLVGRKVGKAHDRNRVRRRLREALRSMNISRPVVIIARPAARDASYWELKDELARLLSKALAGGGGESAHPGVSDDALASARPLLSV